MIKNTERKWRSKITEGLRVKIPKDITEIYRVKKDDIVEWIYDGKGNIRIEIKEMVLRGKNPNIEKVIEKNVAEEKKAKVKKVNEEKKVKVEKVSE